MPYEGDDMTPQAHVPPNLPHYYGGAVRALFIACAILLLMGGTLSADLPLSEGQTVFFAIVLMVTAGITNPAQRWIHWINEICAVIGILIFAPSAFAHYRAGVRFADPSMFLIEMLSVLFLISLYYATKTIRGMLLTRIVVHKQ